MKKDKLPTPAPAEPLHVTAYRVPGVALVATTADRTPAEALEIARRIAADPEGYLSVIQAHRVPGVLDERAAA